MGGAVGRREKGVDRAWEKGEWVWHGRRESGCGMGKGKEG